MKRRKVLNQFLNRFIIQAESLGERRADTLDIV